MPFYDPGKHKHPELPLDQEIETLPERTLSMRQVCVMLSRSSMSIMGMLKRKEMPPPLRLGKGKYVWRWSVLKRWLDELQGEPTHARK